MIDDPRMGIVACGMFLPDTVMTAEEIAAASGLPEWVVRDKLGINRKHIPQPGLHPNAMAARAATQCLEKADVDPASIDLLICTTEEWKEYLLWTAGIDLCEQIGATNAWAFDLHMRCATTISAIKVARSLMMEDPSVDTIMIAGGYAIADFIDLTNPRTSFLWNIGAGAGAMLLKRDWPANRVLGTHLMTDGSMARHVVVPASGTIRHPSDQAVADGLFKFDLVEPEAMKARLGEVSMKNWIHCLGQALQKSGLKPDGTAYSRADVDYLSMLLVKPSAHKELLDRIGLTENQSSYLSDYGHVGEQDTIISIIEGERTGRLKSGDLMVMLGAGIGYVWGAGIVRWGEQGELTA